MPNAPNPTPNSPTNAAVARVTAALEAKDIGKAIVLSRAALDEGVVHPLLLNLRAYWREQQEDFAGSLSDLEQARDLAPNDVTVLNALGLAFGKLERWGEAIEAFDAVIATKPDFAAAHYNKGWNAEFRGDLETAARCYAKAIELNPSYPEALTRSASLAARQGSWAEADRLGAEALAIDDKQFFAIQSQIRAAIARKDFPRAEELISGHLADTRPRPLDQALTYGYLGDLRNAQGRAPEAFAAWTEGNNRRHTIFAPRFEKPGIQSACEYTKWLLDYTNATPAAVLAANHDAIAPPQQGEPRQLVFLVGNPRSGTTLLENVMNSHPDIVSLEERPALKDAVTAYLTTDEGLRQLTMPMRRDLQRLRALYWEHIRKDGVEPAGKVFIDKNPLYLVNLPVVAKMWPGAKVLFALRDPRDVVLSCFRHVFQMNRSMYEYLTLEGAARFYDTLMQLAMVYREKLQLDWCEIRNERLVDDFEGEARKACTFLGVEWNDGMKDFAAKARTRFIATPSATQVMRGISREGVGQWRRYKDQLAPVMPILMPWVERFGYDPD